MGFQAAIAAGYKAKDILAYISRLYPKFQGQLNNAVAAGFSVDQISKYLEKSGLSHLKNFKGIAPSSKEKMGYNPDIGDNSLIKGSNAVPTHIPEGIKTIGKLALGAAGTYALSRAIPAIASKILPAEKEPPETQKSQESLESPLEQENTQILNDGSIKTQSIQPVNEDSSDIIRQMGLESILERLKEHRPEDVEQVLNQHILSPGQKKWLKEKNIPISKLVNDYLAGSENPIVPKENQIIKSEKLGSPPDQVSIEQFEKKSENAETDFNKNLKEEQVKVGKQVIIPSGQSGRVISERQGIATIDVDGEKKNRKIEDLEYSDLSDDQLADLYEKLVSSIPENEISRNIHYASYSPSTNRLAYIPHNGSLYIYDDVPEKWKNRIENAMTLAKTSGGNLYGVWHEGSPSRGAAMSQLIQELKSEKKNQAESLSRSSGKNVKPQKEYSDKFETLHYTFQKPMNAAHKRQDAEKKLQSKKEREAREREKSSRKKKEK